MLLSETVPVPQQAKWSDEQDVHRHDCVLLHIALAALQCIIAVVQVNGSGNFSFVQLKLRQYAKNAASDNILQVHCD
jgi:hypothetical protein